MQFLNVQVITPTVWGGFWILHFLSHSYGDNVKNNANLYHKNYAGFYSLVYVSVPKYSD